MPTIKDEEIHDKKQQQKAAQETKPDLGYPGPVSGRRDTTDILYLKEQQGKATIQWYSSSGMHSTYDWVGLYDREPSEINNEEGLKAWKWLSDITMLEYFITDYPWGTGWTAVWWRRENKGDPYKIWGKTPPTSDNH